MTCLFSLWWLFLKHRSLSLYCGQMHLFFFFMVCAMSCFKVFLPWDQRYIYIYIYIPLLNLKYRLLFRNMGTWLAWPLGWGTPASKGSPHSSDNRQSLIDIPGSLPWCTLAWKLVLAAFVKAYSSQMAMQIILMFTFLSCIHPCTFNYHHLSFATCQSPPLWGQPGQMCPSSSVMSCQHCSFSFFQLFHHCYLLIICSA